MITFLKNKQRAFWTLQILGWMGYGFLRMFNGLANGHTLEYIKPSIVAMCTGFLLSFILRGVYRQVRDKSLPMVTFIAVLMTAFLSLVFSTIETIGHVQLYDPFWDPRGLEFFGNAMFDAYVLLSWTALYFIIHYYLLLEAETRKALKAAAQAQKAQISMLRYQLNPHFLFNTLNAISTLALEEDSKGANAMLSRLSKFLRYTLVHQSTQKMTIAKEVEALELYLDIEKVRFEDRLNIVWEISDEAKSALIPSLLLQPIIENAIKHGIAPMEKGGTIEVSAQVENIKEAPKLKLMVRDDGAGLNAQKKPIEEQSAGVGLKNIQDRLQQLYGDKFSFIVDSVEPSGVIINIEIPLEFK